MMKLLLLSLWCGGCALAFQIHQPAYPHHRIRPLSTRRRRPLASTAPSVVVDTSESAPRDVGTMEEWAAACGIQRSDGFQLTGGDDGADIHAVTTEDLAAESPVLFVPQELILSSARAQQELSGYINEAEDLVNRLELDESIPQFYLMVKILMEYQQGDQSPWFPWLNAMPRIYYNGASMTPFCYECLPPLVASLAMKERVKFINFNQAVQKVDFLGDEIKRDRDLVRWAYQVMLTRSIHVDGDERIVPMADMFNHGTNTEVELRYDEDGNCYAYTVQDVAAGSPLRISYGDPTNPSYFFARYGFLDESSPATFCKIMIKNPSSQLKDLGYDPSRMLFFKDNGAVSEEVYDVLLFQNLSESDRDSAQAFYQAHMSGDVDTKQAIHQHFYPQTLESLQNHVDGFLKQLDELTAKTKGKDVKEHPRIPLILGHNEFVKETFLAVKANL